MSIRVAGSDTTSTAIQSILLAVISTPLVYRCLITEIRQVLKCDQSNRPIQDVQARMLPYLNACILEGIRKFPPLTQLREREVPAGGDILNGYFVPGGTFVGINAWSTQLNKGVFGDDADNFRPERWLEADTERLKAMNQTLELVFGFGATKCLGMQMAMMEIRKVIFEVSQTSVSPCLHYIK